MKMTVMPIVVGAFGEVPKSPGIEYHKKNQDHLNVCTFKITSKT